MKVKTFYVWNKNKTKKNPKLNLFLNSWKGFDTHLDQRGLYVFWPNKEG